jgi:DNA-binding XRE family transcriptional regulator
MLPVLPSLVLALRIAKVFSTSIEAIFRLEEPE